MLLPNNRFSGVYSIKYSTVSNWAHRLGDGSAFLLFVLFG